MGLDDGGNWEISRAIFVAFDNLFPILTFVNADKKMVYNNGL